MRKNKIQIVQGKIYGCLFLFLITFLFSCFFSNPLSGFNPSEKEGKGIKKLQEFHRRDGLPNIFRELNSERQVRIAYIGGSITEAEDGWRNLTFSWFRLNFPQTAIYQIDAGIGGTGSDLGAFRIGRDVLKHKPDLVFIEFAVNDDKKSKEEIHKSMEGIVRQIWISNPSIDICFIYTAKEEHCKKLVEGILHTSVIAMEEVADYYGIPSIHMGVEVARLYANNKLILYGNPGDNEKVIVFTRDHVHPYKESGHPLYASVVVRYLEKMKKKPGTLKHVLPPPFRKDNWENARMLGVSGMEKTGEWELDTENLFRFEYSKFMPHVWKAGSGSKLRFKFEGRVLAIYDVIGPGTGMLKVTIDGDEKTIYRFDSYCSYYRPQMTIITDDLRKGAHLAEIEVVEGGFDKKGILSKERVARMEANPGKYENTDWYLDDILVVE